METRGPGVFLPGELAHTHRGSALPPPWALAPSSAPTPSLPLMLTCVCPSPPQDHKLIEDRLCLVWINLPERVLSQACRGARTLLHRPQSLEPFGTNAPFSLSLAPFPCTNPPACQGEQPWYLVLLEQPLRVPPVPLFLLPGAQSQACRALQSAPGIHHQALCPQLWDVV